MRPYTPHPFTCTATPDLPKSLDRTGTLLREGHRLTTSSAFTLHGIEKLPTIISELRRRGWDITGRSVAHVNTVGDRVTVKEYYLTPERAKAERQWNG